MLHLILLVFWLAAVDAIAAIENTFVIYPTVQDSNSLHVKADSVFSMKRHSLVESRDDARFDGKWFVTGLNTYANAFTLGVSSISNNGHAMIKHDVGISRVLLKSSQAFFNNEANVVNLKDRSQLYDFVTFGKTKKNESLYIMTLEDISRRRTVFIDKKSDFESDGIICSRKNDIIGPFPFGDGCLALHQSSGSFELSSDNVLYGQAVYLPDASSSLSISGTFENKFAATVFGFGGGNKIKISIKYDWIEYIENEGLLILGSLAKGHLAQLAIGKGYDKKFIRHTSTEVSYPLPPPNESVPSECRCSFQLQNIPNAPISAATGLVASSFSRHLVPTKSSENRLRETSETLTLEARELRTCINTTVFLTSCLNVDCWVRATVTSVTVDAGTPLTACTPTGRPHSKGALYSAANASGKTNYGVLYFLACLIFSI